MLAALGERDRDAEQECGLPTEATKLAARRRASWIIGQSIVIGIVAGVVVAVVLRALR